MMSSDNQNQKTKKEKKRHRRKRKEQCDDQDGITTLRDGTVSASISTLAPEKVDLSAMVKSGSSRKRLRCDISSIEQERGEMHLQHHHHQPRIQDLNTGDYVHPSNADNSTVGSSQIQGLEVLADDCQKRSKSRKKKKRKKKQTKVGQSVGFDSSSNGDGGGIRHGEDKDVSDTFVSTDMTRPVPPILEGSMIEDDQFVLIDRKSGTVYSSTERLANGNRKQIGQLNDTTGQVILEEQYRTTTLLSASTLSLSKALQDTEKIAALAPCIPRDNITVSFPFEVDPDDHCESPFDAYQHILPILETYSRRTRHDANKLSIYDPYYCDGQVARHLTNLGFPNVYNRKEDCYGMWDDPTKYRTIQYDVLITNPPYSGDHVERLIRHVTSPLNGGKPWILLMPMFVHKKDYFKQLTKTTHQLPIYLIPNKRYVYEPPPNFRTKKASDTHKKSSPFVSCWYLWGGSQEMTDEWYRVLRAQARKTSTTTPSSSSSFSVARSTSALRDLRRKQK